LVPKSYPSKEGESMDMEKIYRTYYMDFLHALKYDCHIALNRYPFWREMVYNIYTTKSPEFIVSPFAQDYIYEFFEFIDGNGFIVERKQNADEPLHLIVKREYIWN